MPAAALHQGAQEITGPHALDLLGDAHDRLADALDVPMTSRRPWLAAWIGAYPHWDPWAIVVSEGDDLLGACLLAVRDDHQGSLQVTALGHGRNDRTRFPAVSDEVAEVIAQRVAGTLQRRRRPWSLRIEQLPVADPVATALARHLPNAYFLCGGRVPGVDLADGSSPDAALSKNLRRQLQKCRNRIVADAVVGEVAFTRDRPVLHALLDEIELVHRNRDHDVGRTSDIDDAAGRQLWRAIIDTHIDLDRAEVGTLRLDGELAAYVVSFIDHATYRVFDGRFDTHWGRYSPGRLLETAALGRAMTFHGLTRLDWMNSVASDKLIAANTFEPTVHLVATSASG